MGTPYTTAELVALHKRSLLDAASVFSAPEDADFLRHVRVAARAISTGKRTRTLIGTLSLRAGAGTFPSPADLYAVKVASWGADQQLSAPWNGPRGPLPTLRKTLVDGLDNLVLSPAPSCDQISAYGAHYSYYYLAYHQVPTEGDTTITETELDILLLRAKVEAMRELSIRNHNKPVTLRQGQGADGSSQARNTTAAALYQEFLREYQDTP